VTLDQAPGDYYIVASSRFTQVALNGTAILRYSNSGGGAPAPFPPAPAGEIEYSIDQAKSIRSAGIFRGSFLSHAKHLHAGHSNCDPRILSLYRGVHGSAFILLD
jgi:hypothetical protein